MKNDGRCDYCGQGVTFYRDIISAPFTGACRKVNVLYSFPGKYPGGTADAAIFQSFVLLASYPTLWLNK